MIRWDCEVGRQWTEPRRVELAGCKVDRWTGEQDSQEKEKSECTCKWSVQ